MNLLITKIGIEFDKLIIKIYSKTKLDILKRYLQRRVHYHAKIMEKLTKEIIDNGSETAKRKFVEILTEIDNKEE